MNALSSQPFDVRPELFDLCFQTLAMRTVLSCVDGLLLEGGMFEPKGIDLATKAIVLALDVLIFAFAHVLIVARCGRLGANMGVSLTLLVGPDSADFD